MKIVVVIPCRNEALYIQECIDAIFASSLPQNWELKVHVVDGMSTDGTRERIKELMSNHPSLQLVDNMKQLTPFAFNLGIQCDKDADFYQIIGARQIISQNYLKDATEKFLTNPEIWCVGGKVENVYLNDASRTIANAMGSSFGMGLGNFRTLDKSSYVDTVGTPMYPRWVFEKIGLFDEELVRNQDDDFNYRVTIAGGKIYFDHTISLKYYVRGNFNGLWRQFFQYGYWKVYVNKKHEAVTTIRQLIPPLFVFYLFLLPFSGLFGELTLALCAIPLVLYLLCCFVFSMRMMAGFGSFFQLLRTFPTLHLSYGFGYLKGIIHFLVLGQKPSEKEKRLSR